MKYLHLFASVVLLYSCKPVTNSVYGVNKNIAFKGLQEYKNYVEEKYKIDVNNLFYIDQDSYNEFISLVIETKSDYFLGIFLNDSIQVKKSGFLKENESCSGRVMEEIRNASGGISAVSTTKNETFKTQSFTNIVTKIPLQFSKDGRKKIVLIFSYRAGAIHKKDFVQIQNLLESRSDYDLDIISLDKLYDLE
ncbi:MAG TPA: hypothetical protein VIZ28_16380 [Chitinophagaceae bacterium]